MQELNLPKYLFKIKTVGNIKQIFDPIRKKYLVLTPEEWVRQHIIQFLINELGIPGSHIGIETSSKYNGLQKRSDIIVSNKEGILAMIIECKAPSVKLTQNTLNQIALYNIDRVSYLIISNGLNHFCFKLNLNGDGYDLIDYLPDYNEL